jgi:hypothetical protein
MARPANINYQKDGIIFSFQFETSNQKTGDLVQTYMFPAEWLLTDAKISTLSDSKVCFDCDHSKSKKKTCYVRKGFAEMGLASKVRSFRALGLDNIPYFNAEIEASILDAIKGRGVRFGTFGEPILLGEDFTKKIAETADFHTGYTHQWHKNTWAKNYFMASVENGFVDKAAQAMGFRTFFVGVPENPKAYVNCPASKEAGRKATCDNCKLCMGLGSKAKSVYILPH